MAVLVEIAGVDGSGKSTLIGLVRRLISDHGLSWAYERTFRDRTRRFLEQIAVDSGRRRADELFDKELLAFSSALSLVEEVLRVFYFCRSDGDEQVYFVDHYYTSGMAEAIANGVVSMGQVSRIYEYLPRPHVSIFLDVPAEEALRRLKGRPSGDQILRTRAPLDALSRMVAAFHAVHAQIPYAQIRLDACLPVDEVVSAALQLILAPAGRAGYQWRRIASPSDAPQGPSNA